MSTGEVDTDDDQPFLTALGTRIADNHVKIAARMVKKREGTAQAVKLQQIVLLSIPKKWRTSTESLRIPARVVKKTKYVSTHSVNLKGAGD